MITSDYLSCIHSIFHPQLFIFQLNFCLSSNLVFDMLNASANLLSFIITDDQDTNSDEFQSPEE